MKTINLKISIIVLLSVSLLIAERTNASVPKDDISKKNAGLKKSPASKTNLSNVKIKNIQFDFNRANIKAGSLPRLNKVAKLMADNNAALQLSGHADNIGGYVYNWKLSQARAESVKNYLVSKGADSARIAATEFGTTKPIASNKTKKGRERNRRVEVKFVQ